MQSNNRYWPLDLCCSYFRGKGKWYSPASEWREAVRLHSQDLQAVVVADSYPVWLSRCPLYIVDFSLSCIGQDRVLNRTRHLLDIPDESLMVIRCRWKRKPEVESKRNEISTHDCCQVQPEKLYRIWLWQISMRNWARDTTIQLWSKK